ncbi:MAG: hypothetical protein U0W40_14740 [Acidimicrobiia bacterium]
MAALYVWLGVNPYLAYVPTMLLGLAMLLCIVRAVERHDDGRPATRLVPGRPLRRARLLDLAEHRLLPRSRGALARRVPPAGAAAGRAARAPLRCSALPWIWNNVHYGFDSLTAKEGLARRGYLDHLRYVFTHVLPAALGMRGVLDGRWIIGGADWANWVVYVAVLAVLAFGVWRGLQRRSVAAIGLCTAPFVFAYVPFATNLANDWIGNGRYFYFFTPFVVLTIAQVVRPIASAAVVAVAARRVEHLGLHPSRPPGCVGAAPPSTT